MEGLKHEIRVISHAIQEARGLIMPCADTPYNITHGMNGFTTCIPDIFKLLLFFTFAVDITTDHIALQGNLGEHTAQFIMQISTDFISYVLYTHQGIQPVAVQCVEKRTDG